MAFQEMTETDVAEPRRRERHDEETRRHGPDRRVNRDHFLELDLAYATHKIRRVTPDGAPPEYDVVKLRSYNGKLGGPTIEAEPGDTLYIKLDNQLPREPEADSAHDPHPGPGHGNAPHGFNTSNLHFHGLHVSPTGNSDNVLIELPPKHSFPYEVKIPYDHPAGTYWYHAHKHGSATLHLASGMAGALIIRGDIDRVPAIKDACERIILFQQIPYTLTDDPTAPGQKANMVESYSLFGPGVWQSLGRRFTLNGEVEPTYELNPGEVQRWRFIHGGIREGLKLRLVRREGNVETPLSQFQIAHDGITTGRIDEVTETEMFPGYRVDVMVRATDDDGRPLNPGTYYLVDALATGPAHTLARVCVKGKPVRMALPKAEQLAPLAPFKGIGNSEVTGQQEVIFSIDTSVTPPRFLVNGKPFDPHHVRQVLLGDVEEWKVGSLNFNHPFHIHVNPFQVKLQDGRLIWKDTLMVMAGQTFRLRTRYERYIGKFMMHCHIAEHGDLGMAELVEVLAPYPGHTHGPH
ncbi:multicopper oxidase domain-containing protein [Pyxidicoccus fallax]|uniref:Multicopper oxidase domain-containing protein n=1 Tax=Pyxidicoccus fallax TaxID=394095 RepID=A0A848LLN6_9BACT|nr:multicopper oxidase family protein [Pyxidicoccus fallax]NMO18737.1 multicopper oxidase domain-containing protein [Pyxidicoccus fallax]NPC79194.1 multicopper oxidase domain-containing protein [Pyxidicoccus fallax]